MIQQIINDIRKLNSEGKIKWTAHIITRLQERNINPNDIKECIMNGEIIECYPDDYPYPSYLINGKFMNNKHIHVVIGIGECFIWLISAYKPDINKWDDSFKNRKGF